MSNQSYPLFSLGQAVATHAALLHLERSGIHPGRLLERHATGDWGDLCEFDQKANESAIHDGTRILSAYMIAGQRLYVITEADRSHTTILLASEY